MKHATLYLLAGLFILPSYVHAQTDSLPPWVLRGGDITETSLDEILPWARGLDFDLDPWDAPDGPLILPGPSGPYLGPRARFAARMGAHGKDPETLPGGRFVGLFETDVDVPALGLVQGRNYLWVDRKGPGNRWRGLIIPDRVWPDHPSMDPKTENADTFVYAVEVRVEVFDNRTCGDAQGAFISGVARCVVWDCTVTCSGAPTRAVGFPAPTVEPLRGGLPLGPLWNPRTGSGGWFPGFPWGPAGRPIR